MENKITLKQYFTEIKGILAELGRDDLADVMQSRIDLLDKKSANRKPKAQSEEDIQALEALKAQLSADGDTVTNLIIKANLSISTPKATSLLKPMVDSGEIVKEKSGKSQLYKLA